jgi:hypothetical protein
LPRFGPPRAVPNPHGGMAMTPSASCMQCHSATTPAPAVPALPSAWLP